MYLQDQLQIRGRRTSHPQFRFSNQAVVRLISWSPVSVESSCFRCYLALSSPFPSHLAGGSCSSRRFVSSRSSQVRWASSPRQPRRTSAIIMVHCQIGGDSHKPDKLSQSGQAGFVSFDCKASLKSMIRGIWRKLDEMMEG